MKFTPLPIHGAFLIDIEPLTDERGTFARTFCVDEFGAHGLATSIVQSSTVFTARRNTLRGLHFQLAPYQETKLARCTRGAAYVVMVDLRPASPSYLLHFGAELSADNRRSLYVPAGCAQGYQTLVDETELLYQMDVRYSPEHARGVRWNDPAFGITWPLRDPIMHPRDASFPDYTPVVAANG